MIKTARAVFYFILIYFYLGCASPPRMVNYYNYNMPKDEVLNLCKTILIKLDYEIDILAPETNMIVTKSTKLRKVLRRYDYVVYVKITDKVEIYLSSERSIFSRNSSWWTNNYKTIKEFHTESKMPYSLQKVIFRPIKKEFERNNIQRIELG